MVADHLSTVLALVRLVVARLDAERNEAAAKDAADESEDHAEDPGEAPCALFHFSFALDVAILTDDPHRHGWPVVRRESRLVLLNHLFVDHCVSLGLD